jgi:quinol monooxygenase YgiN
VIVVAATIDYADQASRDAAVAASASVQLATRTDEPGCHAYCFAADPSVPTRIQVYELWEDEGSLAAHFTHPNYLQMREVLGAHGITRAWNRMYEVGRNEPVYGPNGQIRTRFFTEPAAEAATGPAAGA